MTEHFTARPQFVYVGNGERLHIISGSERSRTWTYCGKDAGDGSATDFPQGSVCGTCLASADRLGVSKYKSTMVSLRDPRKVAFEGNLLWYDSKRFGAGLELGDETIEEILKPYIGHRVRFTVEILGDLP